MLFAEINPHARRPALERFKSNWTAYLNQMSLNEETAAAGVRLPHCHAIGERFEKSKCEWNPHTELCLQYKHATSAFDAGKLKLEPLYRKWRKLYLAAPSKPSFRYPSSKRLPLAKIFGGGIFPNRL